MINNTTKKYYNLNLGVLKEDLKDYEIPVNEQRKIKILNFLNYHCGLFDIIPILNVSNEEAELLENGNNKIKITIINKLLTCQNINENKFTFFDILNLYSHIYYVFLYLILDPLLKKIFKHSKYVNNENSYYPDVDVINTLINETFVKKDFEFSSDFKKNWFSIILAIFANYKGNQKITKFFTEINKNNIGVVEFCLNNDTSCENLRLLLFEIMMELAMYSDNFKNYSKNLKKPNELKKLIFLTPEIVYSDRYLIIYNFSYLSNLYVSIKGEEKWYKLNLKVINYCFILTRQKKS